MQKILVADDEKEIRELIKIKLEKSGYEVAEAPDGEQAVKLALSIKPDLVMLDIAMPGLDGYQACEALRKDSTTKKIPVLFLTGKEFNPHAVVGRAEQLGACGYITKLTTLQELADKVKEVIG